MKFASNSIIALAASMSIAGTAGAEAFNGPSVGVQAGWVETKVHNPKTNFGVTGIDASKDSAMLGGFLAYDKKFGKIVLGGEAGLNFGTSDRVSGGSATNAVTIDPKRSLDLTARVGYLVTPRTLLYARGGYTNDRVRTTLTAANGTQHASESRDGWLAGVGVEHMLTSRISARVEYRYADLGNGHGTYDRNEILTGVAFHF